MEKRNYHLIGKLKIGSINATNIDEVYNKYYNRFLIENSDEVKVNGEIISRKFEKINLTGSSVKNFEGTIETNNKRSGFDLTELHFIDSELEILKNFEPKNFEEKEKLKLYLEKLNQRKTEIESKENSNVDEKEKPELNLNDFFNKEVSNDIILSIQENFKRLEGKELAILIYLLNKEHQIIEIITNSKTKGRKGFVKCLKDNDSPAMQKINKCFVPNTDNLIYSHDDLNFQSISNRLKKIIKT